jgi:chromosome partitioning protein
MKLTIGNLKGGVAKTTTTVHLGAALAASGERVLCIDADPQAASLLDWSTVAGEAWPDNLTVIPWSGKDLARRIRAVADDYDHVLVDTGGENDEILSQALLVTDDLIVPVAPSLIELRRLPATFSLAAKIDAISPVTARVLLCKVRRTRSAGEARELLEGLDIPVMAASIGLREMYSASFGTLPAEFGEYADVVAELRATA